MHWLELHIDTTHDGLDPITALLSSLGIDNVMIDDEEEFRSFLEETRPHWDYVDEALEREMRGKSRVTFYLLAGDAGLAKLAEVRIALQELKESRSDCGTLLLTLENVQDADWETSWKQYYKPLPIGERLLVVPQWEAENPGGPGDLRLPSPSDFGPGIDVRHGKPRHHPVVPDSARAPYSGRRTGAGSGLRQRHSLHCRAAAGRGLRPGSGY